MATNNAVNTPLSGQTGTGNFVGATSPTLITPVLGVASATSLAFSSTSGIIGTTTNNDAAAGSVGELISSTVLVGAAVSLTTTVSADITSISLTAGDWDVWGICNCTVGGSTTTSRVSGWISTTSATPPTAPNEGAYCYMDLSAAANTGEPTYFYAGQKRISLAGTTTVYLSVNCAFATSTMGAFGFIGARRIR